MRPYFIRHKFNGDEKVLCNSHRIAIDFENRRVDKEIAEPPPDIIDTDHHGETSVVHTGRH